MTFSTENKQYFVNNAANSYWSAMIRNNCMPLECYRSSESVTWTRTPIIPTEKLRSESNPHCRATSLSGWACLRRTNSLHSCTVNLVLSRYCDTKPAFLYKFGWVLLELRRVNQIGWRFISRELFQFLSEWHWSFRALRKLKKYDYFHKGGHWRNQSAVNKQTERGRQERPTILFIDRREWQGEDCGRLKWRFA